MVNYDTHPHTQTTQNTLFVVTMWAIVWEVLVDWRRVAPFSSSAFQFRYRCRRKYTTTQMQSSLHTPTTNMSVIFLREKNCERERSRSPWVYGPQENILRCSQMVSLLDQNKFAKLSKARRDHWSLLIEDHLWRLDHLKKKLRWKSSKSIKF